MMMQRDWVFQQEARKPKAVGETLASLWRYFRRYAHVLVGVGVLVVVSTFLQVTIPNLIGQAVDCFLAPTAPGARCWFATPASTSDEQLQGLAGIVLLIASLYAASALLTGLQFFLMTYAGQHVLRALRVEVFAHIHRLSLGYYSKHEAGDVMSRITNDADTLQQAISFPLVSVVQGALLIFWIAYTMLTESLALAIVALAVTPVMFVATSWLSGRARQAFRKVRSRVGDVNASLQENL